MQLGMNGLGRMGGTMVRRLVNGGHQLVVYARTPEAVKANLTRGDPLTDARNRARHRHLRHSIRLTK